LFVAVAGTDFGTLKYPEIFVAVTEFTTNSTGFRDPPSKKYIG
jgi:hypothetical protein